jgi:hypothetical protein
LHVSLLITDDLYASANFSMQLNAVNALTPNIIWMQFIFFVSGATITPNVQYHDISPQESNQCSPFPGTAGTPFQIGLPPNMANGLPAGSLLEIDLQTVKGNVSQATFKFSQGAFSNNEWGNFQLVNSQSIATIPSAQQITANQAKPACSAQQQSAMANGLPVTAFELNLVGSTSGSVSFSKGDGLITYTSDNGFCAEDGPNDNACTGQDDQTGETSNASYGAMNPCCGNTITQQLSYSPGAAPQ